MVKQQSLDVEKVSVTEQGINNFYWPVSASEMYDIYLQLLDRIIDYLRDAQKRDIPGIDAARIIYNSFLSDVLPLYEAYLLLSRSDREGVEWCDIERNPWVRIIQQKQKPEIAARIQRLQRGPSVPSQWRVPLRLARDLLVERKEGMIRRSWRSCNYEKDIVSLSLNPLATQYTREVSEKVYYHREEFWFRKPTSLLLPERYSLLIEGFLNSVTSVLKDIPDSLILYFKGWLQAAIPLVDAYLKQLDEKKHFPKKLWVSTSGHLWGRIMARYVTKNGGHVTRFDHGGGAAYFDDSHAHGAHDYEDCHRFVTYSVNMAKARKEAFSGQEVVQAVSPDITSVSAKMIRKNLKTSRLNSPIKKIMYVASIYPNGYFYPAGKGMMRDHVLLDWEIRLMAQLKKWSYEVIFKPHPADTICLAPPRSIENLLGPVQMNKIFEEVYHQADLILIDNLSTSLFSTLVCSGKPFVYLDFGVTKFSDQALSLFQKRCPIVRGYYDQFNRAILDWDQLKKAVESAPQYNDNSFENFYF